MAHPPKYVQDFNVYFIIPFILRKVHNFNQIAEKYITSQQKLEFFTLTSFKEFYLADK